MDSVCKLFYINFLMYNCETNIISKNLYKMLNGMECDDIINRFYNILKTNCNNIDDYKIWPLVFTLNLWVGIK